MKGATAVADAYDDVSADESIVEISLGFGKERVELAGREVLVDLRVPCDAVEFRKPVPKVRKLLRRQRTDGVSEGLEVGHEKQLDARSVCRSLPGCAS